MIYEFKNVKCLEVIDGDTIKAQVNIGFYLTTIQKFRFYRINSPESRTTDEEEKKKGLETKEFLKKLIEGKDIIITSHKEDKYGRWLVEVYEIDEKGEKGRNINDWLVLNKLAIYKDYD